MFSYLGAVWEQPWKLAAGWELAHWEVVDRVVSPPCSQRALYTSVEWDMGLL